MTKITIPLLSALNVFIVVSLSFNAHAQKLPKVQKIAVRAPGDIKIDGKTMEWNDEFQAYNTVNCIYYTVSNDDKNLYLTLKTEGSLSSKKMLSGGLTFTVVSAVKKKSTLSLTFPALRKISSPEIELLQDSPNRYENFNTDSIANKTKIDSLINSCNRQIKNNFKDIQVSEMKDIHEPLISIYNEQSIKASASINRKMQMIYELSVPLKYLGEDVNGKFKYNIKMNSFPTIAVPGGTNPITFPNLVGIEPEFLYLNYTTDFWGEYTLALK